MLSPASCPCRENLQLLLVGQLTQTLRRDLEQHVLGCTACQEVLEQIGDVQNPVLKEIRRRAAEVATNGSHADRSSNPPHADFTPRSGLHLSGAAPESGILGDYRILREIGRGGMGIVFEAEQISLGRHVALKILPFVNLLDPVCLKRFQNEARAAASLEHLHIVPVYAVGADRGVQFYAMRFIDGQNLEQVIKHLRQLESAAGEPGVASHNLLPNSYPCSATTIALPADIDHRGFGNGSDALRPFITPCPSTSRQYTGPGTGYRRDEAVTTTLPNTLSGCKPGESAYFASIVRLVMTAAEALEYAHNSGVLHRDIKPSNLMIDDQGHLWITDFGLARMNRKDEGSTPSGPVLGTIRYMSPENALGNQGIVDQRSDIYSLGVTLYELLTLTPIFPEAESHDLLQRILTDLPRPPRQVSPQIPRDLETIVLKAMAKEPSERYPTALDFAADLKRFLQHEPIRARRPGWLERTAKWFRRHPTSLLALVLLTLGALVAVAGMLWHTHRTSRLNQQLDETNQDLNLARGKLQTALDDVRANESNARRQIYAQDIRQSAQAVADHDPRQALTLLERYTSESATDAVHALEWNILRHRCLGYGSSRRVSNKPLYDIRYSPDGTEVAIAGADAVIRVYDVATWKPRLSISTDQIEINSIPFSPDGTQLASSGDDGSIRLWDRQTGQEKIRIPHAHETKVFHLIFTPDSRQLISCGNDNLVRFWNTTTGAAEGTLEGHAGYIDTVQISRDGRQLLTASQDGTSRIWQLPERRQEQILQSHRGRVVTAVFSPDNLQVATGGIDHSVMLWNTLTGKATQIATLPDTVQAMAFCSGGKQLLISDRGGTLHVFTLSNRSKKIKAEETSTWLCHNGRGQALAVSADEKQILSVGWDGQVRIFNSQETDLDGVVPIQLPEGASPYRFTQREEILSVDPGNVSTDGKVSDSAEILSLRTKERRRFINHTSWPVSSAALTPDGRSLLLGHQSGRISIQETESASPVAVWDLDSSDRVSEMLLTPDGKTVIARLGTDADGVRVLDFPSGRRQPQFPKAEARMIALAPNGTTLGFAYSLDAYLWDLAGPSPNPRHFPHRESVRCLAFSPDGSVFAVSGADRIIRLYDVATGTLRVEMVGHAAEVSALCYSPTGRTLVSGDDEGYLKFWQASSGRFLFDFAKHRGSITQVEFSPQGRYFSCGTSLDPPVVHDLQRINASLPP